MVAGPVALAGHSAGGHLVARMVEPGILPDPVAARLTHVMPISPVADLRPLLKTSMNAQFGLDMDKAVAESPVLMDQRHDVPVSVWVGAEERPVFLEQAMGLAEAWNSPLHIQPALHHFDIIDAMVDGDSRMVADLLG